jgi:hypothetical protein
MKKAHKTMKTRSQGAKHDVTTKTSKNPRPIEVGLHPNTALEVMVTRALDQELEWYFSYAESALHRESIGILPTYAAVRALATEPTDAAVRGRALDIARTVRGCLIAMQPRHAEILRAAYTPRTWPKNVHKAFNGLSAIVVRLAFADDPWPQRSSGSGLERAAATRLAAQLVSSSVSVTKLRNQAQRLLGGAVVAYAGLRALEGVALGLG